MCSIYYRSRAELPGTQTNDSTREGVQDMKLSKWLLTVFVVFALIAAYGSVALAQTSEGHKIKKVREVGRFIELQDGSVWSILNPEDQVIAYGWLPFQNISVLNGNELRNDHNGERIDADRIQGPTMPKASAAPSSTPVYSEKVAGKPHPVQPSPRQSSADQKLLKKILERLDTLDAKIQVMDWRLRKIEKETLGKP